MNHEQDDFWQEFSGLGADEVRKRIVEKRYDDHTVSLAREWLSSLDSLHAQEDIRALRALMRKFNESTSDSNKMALEAIRLANSCNSLLRETSLTAESASKEANASTKSARLALFAAVAALVIAIAGMFFH